MKTIAIIPARGESKRLPNKNQLLLGGIPLVAHSILYALANSQYIDAVFVSTDSAAIKKIALDFGAQVIDRPSELSGDFEPTVSAVKHALQQLECKIENVILLQPTNPIRPANLLQDCLQNFHQKKCDSLFTVSQNHQKLGRISNSVFEPFNYKFGQRSQDLEPLFCENGLLYIAKAALVQNNIIISENAFPYIMNSDVPIVDIDTQADLDYAEYLYKTIK